MNSPWTAEALSDQFPYLDELCAGRNSCGGRRTLDLCINICLSDQRVGPLSILVCRQQECYLIWILITPVSSFYLVIASSTVFLQSLKRTEIEMTRPFGSSQDACDFGVLPGWTLVTGGEWLLDANPFLRILTLSQNIFT